MGSESASWQQTLKNTVVFSGMALHTGGRATARIEPAPADHGICFIREDVGDDIAVPAHIRYARDVQRATTIGVDEQHYVVLVEHILSALFGLGIDNARVIMDGPEPPVLDGSAREIVVKIQEAGIKRLRKKVQTYTVREPVWSRAGDSFLAFLPGNEKALRLTCTVSYGVSQLDTQYFSVVLDAERYRQELAPARTFCENYEEIANLMRMGLIRGASLDNAMVICDGAIVCKEGMRFTNELVRHKMLDIVGDLALLGRRLQGDIIACLPGHSLNVSLARRIDENDLLIPT
ncbi:MAG: UDP-3-O-[3-hydroxymyristoyl] N-acetylglucosamine deacetylase [Lentisphaerae bacterium]|nr:MAG: UDP-3-O-[3-hydroxymyristoyl] N-acetylglucosamine deacetylase [Lentisphaerota bacterium]